MENYDRQQIGGYFSQTNASKDEALKGIVAARISLASDIADNMYTAFDRENAIKYLDISDTEFARITYKGTKFHPVTPLLSPVRVQGMTKPVYLKDSLDALKNNGLVRPKKPRGKYKTKN